MLAFIDTPITLKQFSDNIEAQYAADNIIPRTYWNKKQGKGCAVGCSIYPFIGTTRQIHKEAERITNVPEVLWWFMEKIFDGLPPHLQKEFPIRFKDALKEGSDYSLVQWELLLWMLTEVLPKYLEGDEPYKIQCRDALLQCTNVIESAASGGKIDKAAARAAARAADDAAARAADDAAARDADAVAYAVYAARAAADAADAVAYAVYAARAAADAADAVAYAAYAARAAADSADAVAYAARAAEATAYESMADKLIKLMNATNEQVK